MVMGPTCPTWWRSGPCPVVIHPWATRWCWAHFGLGPIQSCNKQQAAKKPHWSSHFLWYIHWYVVSWNSEFAEKPMMHVYFKMGNVLCLIVSDTSILCNIRLPAMSTASPCCIRASLRKCPALFIKSKAVPRSRNLRNVMFLFGRKLITHGKDPM